MKQILIIFLTAQAVFAADNNSDIALVAGMGDSITSATFAENSALTTPEQKRTETLPFLEVLKDGILKLGSNKYEFSWSTGNEIHSHAAKIKEWAQVNDPHLVIEVKNTSTPTVKIDNLPEQADEIVELMKSGSYRSLKYVTITIGGNDVCHPLDEKTTSDDEFRKHFKITLQKLATIEQDEPIRVLVAAIPNAPDLAREDVAKMKTIHDWTCKELRQKHNSCESLLSWKTPEEYNLALAEVNQKNAILKASVDEINKENPGHIEAVFSSAFFDSKVQLEWLAVDCFHANKLGQQTLSDLNWQDQPWFK